MGQKSEDGSQKTEGRKREKRIDGYCENCGRWIVKIENSIEPTMRADGTRFIYKRPDKDAGPGESYCIFRCECGRVIEDNFTPAEVEPKRLGIEEFVCGDHWDGLTGETVDGNQGCPWCIIEELTAEVQALEENEPGEGEYKSLKEAAEGFIKKGSWKGLNPHKVKRLCVEYENTKNINKELARMIGCLEPDENGKPVCGPTCVCCKALGRK